MTEQEIEIAILQRYVEHHDAVGLQSQKCARELDMKDVISAIIGRPVEDSVVQRWHSRLAPPSPYPPGILRPCSDSTVNNSSHRFHARAYFEPGKAPAWDRLAEPRRDLSRQSAPAKEKEQKFGILLSIKQATPDFALYSSGLGPGVCVGALFIDIDNFKSLNTRFTESVVDQEVLVLFQRLLSTVSLYRGEAYRHGGEEFLVLLPNHTTDEVIQFAERLRHNIEKKEFSIGGNIVHLTVSIGIALWPQHGDTLTDLIRGANQAEHSAKAKGKNRIEVYDEST